MIAAWLSDLSDWVSSANDWARDRLPLLQLVIVLLTGLTAVAAWRSAGASRRAAKHADQTATRAAEALGRSKQPNLQLDVRYDQALVQSPNPIPMSLEVLNTSVHPARDVSVAFDRTDGNPAPPGTTLGWIGPNRAARTADLGMVPRSRPRIDVQTAQENSTVLIITVTVRFRDESGFVPWERKWGISEDVHFRQHPTTGDLTGDPIFSYQVRPFGDASVVPDR